MFDNQDRQNLSRLQKELDNIERVKMMISKLNTLKLIPPERQYLGIVNDDDGQFSLETIRREIGNNEMQDIIRSFSQSLRDALITRRDEIQAEIDTFSVDKTA